MGALVVVVALMGWGRQRWRRVSAMLMLLVGGMALVLASPLMPWPVRIPLLLLLPAWCLLTWRQATPRTLTVATTLLIMTLLACIALELRWFIWRGPGQATYSRVVIIGDSVAAGIGGVHERTWPLQLHQRLGVDVLNAAAAGARVDDALQRQLPHVEPGAALVLLEIGGNDMLFRVPLDRFEHDLDALIRNAVAPDRTVVMFELPTPPFHARYAAIQRRLAARHEVRLIPRRHFIAVIADPAATSDGVHLSQHGHDRMADLVVTLLGPSLVPAKSAVYRSPNSRTLLVPAVDDDG